MRLSNETALGIRGMVYLAQNHDKGLVPLHQICRDKSLPEHYMYKVFSYLKTAGLVRSARGRGAGYALNRSPESISILDIIQAIDGPLAVNFCQSDPPACNWHEEDCLIRPLWSELQEFAVRKLGEFTLDRVIQ